MTTEDKADFFMLFIRGIRDPLRMMSTVDLIDTWLKQVDKRAKTNTWWDPIRFQDENGVILGAFMASDIVSIIRGVPEEVSAMIEQAEAQAKAAEGRKRP